MPSTVSAPLWPVLLKKFKADHAGHTLSQLGYTWENFCNADRKLDEVLTFVSRQNRDNTSEALNRISPLWIVESGARDACDFLESMNAAGEAGSSAQTCVSRSKLVHQSPWSGLRRKTTRFKMPNALFIMAFVYLDQVYEHLWHKDLNGHHKTRLAEVKACRGCDNCVDYAKSHDSRCRCGCDDNQHYSPTWTQKFIENGAGFMLLTFIADSIYENLCRTGLEIDERTMWDKRDIQSDIESCEKCGCTDFDLRQPTAPLISKICVCGHSLFQHHRVSWKDDSARTDIFLTCLNMIMDNIYIELNHRVLVPSFIEDELIGKTSIFEIEACGDCADFNYSPANHACYFQDEHAERAGAKCFCGQERQNHHRE